ncbi:MAG: sulfate adenylyltransferase subunit CysN, partial [Planctomycetota bacterium]|nr:sulfate adenylyltransferase subunit CysN [Planctomycetota bacterium]
MTLSFTAGGSVNDYLDRYERNELLRFLTCGSVDDGKSTLIGRLLYDTGRLYDDHLKAIESESKVHGTQGGALDLALVVDGLKAEREQGITIDVAYRYFATARRSFIIADCPGHEQYTRNMATGASHCQLAITLIDARHGVSTQTRRHAFIASLLGLRQVVAAVNKMDLVGWSEAKFREIEREFMDFCARLGIDPVVIPVSALTGENVVKRGLNTPWYSGSPILELLETLPVDHPSPDAPFRLPVQYVIRPSLDFRGFAGTISSGSVKVGDRVRILPSGRETRVRRIARSSEDGGDLAIAIAPQSIVMTFEDEVDCSRGDVVSSIGGMAEAIVAQSFEADLVWMDETPLMAGKSFILKNGTRSISARIVRVCHRVDVNTLETHIADTLSLNDIGRIEIETEQPLAFDSYRRIRQAGAIILIDRLTNATSAAGMIRTGDANDPHIKRAHWETIPISSIKPTAG